MKNLIILLISASSFTAHGQNILTDPSFETAQGSSSWSSCEEHSTPDTQPGKWGVEKQAHDGFYFASLVTRGESDLIPSNVHNTSESLIHILNTEGKAGEPYILRFYTAHSEVFEASLNFGNDILNFTETVRLEILLGGEENECEFEEQIAKTSLIKKSSWEKNEYFFTAESDFESILFRAVPKKADKYKFGNVLIDNVFLANDKCLIDIPNTFTPNDDGINDNFRIVNLDCDEISNFQISIFDRWGKKVFRSSELDFFWDGKVLGKSAIADTYVYSISYSKNDVVRNISGDLSLIK